MGLEVSKNQNNHPFPSGKELFGSSNNSNDNNNNNNENSDGDDDTSILADLWEQYLTACAITCYQQQQQQKGIPTTGSNKTSSVSLTTTTTTTTPMLLSHSATKTTSSVSTQSQQFIRRIATDPKLVLPYDDPHILQEQYCNLIDFHRGTSTQPDVLTAAAAEGTPSPSLLDTAQIEAHMSAVFVEILRQCKEQGVVDFEEGKEDSTDPMVRAFMASLLSSSKRGTGGGGGGGTISDTASNNSHLSDVMSNSSSSISTTATTTTTAAAAAHMTTTTTTVPTPLLRNKHRIMSVREQLRLPQNKPVLDDATSALSSSGDGLASCGGLLRKKKKDNHNCAFLFRGVFYYVWFDDGRQQHLVASRRDLKGAHFLLSHFSPYIYTPLMTKLSHLGISCTAIVCAPIDFKATALPSHARVEIEKSLKQLACGVTTQCSTTLSSSSSSKIFSDFAFHCGYDGRVYVISTGMWSSSLLGAAALRTPDINLRAQRNDAFPFVDGNYNNSVSLFKTIFDVMMPSAVDRIIEVTSHPMTAHRTSTERNVTVQLIKSVFREYGFPTSFLAVALARMNHHHRDVVPRDVFIDIQVEIIARGVKRCIRGSCARVMTYRGSMSRTKLAAMEKALEICRQRAMDCLKYTLEFSPSLPSSSPSSVFVREELLPSLHNIFFGLHSLVENKLLYLLDSNNALSQEIRTKVYTRVCELARLTITNGTVRSIGVTLSNKHYSTIISPDRQRGVLMARTFPLPMMIVEKEHQSATVSRSKFFTLPASRQLTALRCLASENERRTASMWSSCYRSLLSTPEIAQDAWTRVYYLGVLRACSLSVHSVLLGTDYSQELHDEDTYLLCCNAANQEALNHDPISSPHAAHLSVHDPTLELGLSQNSNSSHPNNNNNNN
eukprot:PhM_4_TR5166/c0_g1_i1/m.79861